MGKLIDEVEKYLMNIVFYGLVGCTIAIGMMAIYVAIFF